MIRRGSMKNTMNTHFNFKPISVGTKYNRLTMVRYSHQDKKQSAVYEWLCDCGNIKLIAGTVVKRGKAISCGCYAKERTSEIKRTHGGSVGNNGKDMPEYQCWCRIRQVCYNPKNSGYYKYGGRGITMSPEWYESFDNFYRDMGPRPTKDHSIERDKVNGIYEKTNCRWATLDVQANNKRRSIRIHYKGKSLNFNELSALLDIPRKTFKWWWDSGKEPYVLKKLSEKGLL